MTGRMWIERQELDGGTVRFKVMEEGVYWPNKAHRAENLQPVVSAEIWRHRNSDPQVSWPSTSDKRPELAMMLGHALQFAAIEAQTGKPSRVFANGGYFAPRGLEVAI